MLLHAFDGFGQVQHAFAQFASDTPTFFLAHLIEAVESLIDLIHHRGLNLALGTVMGRVEGAGDAQDGVEIGFSSQGKLGRGCSECGDVSADNFAVQRKSFAGAALQAE